MTLIGLSQNLAVMGGMLYLITTGNGWWSLLLVFFVLVPKNKDD